MKRQTTAVILAAVLASAGALADEHDDGMKFEPVEIYACNYRDGKDRDDLQPVIDDWNEWMDGNDDTGYFAMLMHPFFYGAGENVFDVAWLGSWPDGASMGAGLDAWVTEGGELGAGFDAVIDCPSHGNFASTMLKSPGEGPPPDTLVVTFSDCDVDDPSNWDALMEGTAAWTAHQDERGYGNGSWMLFPAYGGGNESYDYKYVEGWDDFSELGKAYDLYGTGGDWAKHGELVGQYAHCDAARVYYTEVVRAGAAPDAD